jgi:hypothetical protein
MVRRQRRRTRIETIPDAANSFQICRSGTVGLNFAANSSHAGIHTARCDELRVAPHGIQKLIAIKDAPLVPGQIIHQTELQRRWKHLIFSNEYLHSRSVNFKTTRFNRSRIPPMLHILHYFLSVSCLGYQR